MKKLTLLTGMLFLFIVSSCRDVVNTVLDVLPPFDVPFSTTIEVPFAAVSTTSYTRAPELEMNIDLDAKIKEQNQNFSINNLKSVKLNALTVEYVNSQLGNKLDVIKNANLYIKSPNQPEKLIASVQNNTNPNSITFSSNDAELIDYFRTNKNSLIIEVMASRASTDIITMKLNTGFKIRVQL